MRPHPFSCNLVILVAVLTAGTSQAATVSFNFSGAVFNVSPGIPFTAGETVSGMVTYDSNAPFATNITNGNRYSDASLSLMLAGQTSGSTITGTTGNIHVTDDGSNSRIDLTLSNGFLINGGSGPPTPTMANVLLLGPTGQYPTLVPPTSIDFSDFPDFRDIAFFFAGNTRFDVRLDSLTQKPVPEPTSIALVLTGLVALATTRRD